jgi:hypothetical protein
MGESETFLTTLSIQVSARKIKKAPRLHSSVE